MLDRCLFAFWFLELVTFILGSVILKRRYTLSTTTFGILLWFGVLWLFMRFPIYSASVIILNDCVGYIYRIFGKKRNGKS